MMEKHETKQCPCCGAAFECKPGNITQCQCYGIKLDEETKQYLEKKYGDCLCRACLSGEGKEDKKRVGKC